MIRAGLLGALALVACLAYAGPLPVDPLQPDLSEFEPGVREALARGLEEFADRAEAPRGAAEAWGRLGVVYQAHHLQTLAEACYRHAVAEDPDRFRWRYLLAYVLSEQAQWQAAADGYQAALALAPDYLPARLRLGQALLATRDLDGAEAAFGGALAADPGNAAALAGLGRVALARDRHGEAARLLEAALAADPRATRLHHPLGMAYRALGDLDRARRHLAARGNSEPVFSDPELAEVGRQSRSAQVFLERGYAAARSGRLDEAVSAFRQAVEVAPDNIIARISLGQGLTLAGRYEAALEALDAALALDPAHPQAHYRRGVALESLGRDAAAAEDYRAVLAAEPGHPQAGLRLGDALMRLGDARGAVEAYEAVDLPAGRRTLVDYRQGIARLAAGDCGRAIDVLEAALAETPGQGEIYQALARAYATCPAVDAAGRARGLALARQLFAARPDAAHARTLAMAQAAAGELPAAITLQERLLAADGDGDSRTVAWDADLLERFRRGLPAVTPWPDWHPVFHPEPLGAGPDTPGDR